MTKGNGWRTGRDPVQRRLRIITSLVMLTTFVVLTVVPPERGTEHLAFAGLTLAALLILLGYEGLIRLPVIGRRNDDDERS